MTSGPDDGDIPGARSSNEEMNPANTPPFTTSGIDPERIAALIDGRLDAAQRAQLLAEIDADPAAFEAYADAVAVREIEAEAPTTAGVRPITSAPSRRGRRSQLAWVAVAALILIAVALPLSLRRSNARSLDDIGTMVAAVPRNAPSISVTAQSAPWSELRGAGDALTPRARALRMGARIADLQLLTRAGDTVTTPVIFQIASLLDGIPAGGIASSEFRSLAPPSGAPSDSALRRAVTFAEQVAGQEDVRLGAWLEIARVAATERDSSFVNPERLAPIVRTIRALPDGRPATMELLARLSRAVDARDWPAIRIALDELLRDLATP